MKRVVIGSLVGVAMLAAIPFTLPLITQYLLIRKAEQQTQQGKPLEAIETFQRALVTARKIQDRGSEAFVHLGMGFNYDRIDKLQEALSFYNQALIIFREIDSRGEEATTLNNIGAVYSRIGQPESA